MRYFQQFPTVQYQTTEVLEGVSRTFNRTVPNMSLRFTVDLSVGSYSWYTIVDRDRPDTLAGDWYGSPEYAWVVMLSNNLRDLYDWPMTEVQFSEYLNRKYATSSTANDGLLQSSTTVHEYIWVHPVTQQEIVVDAAGYADLPIENRRVVTVYDEERRLNDARQRIKRLTFVTFQSFVSQFQQAMKETNV